MSNIQQKIKITLQNTSNWTENDSCEIYVNLFVSSRLQSKSKPLLHCQAWCRHTSVGRQPHPFIMIWHCELFFVVGKIVIQYKLNKTLISKKMLEKSKSLEKSPPDRQIFEHLEWLWPSWMNSSFLEKFRFCSEICAGVVQQGLRDR